MLFYLLALCCLALAGLRTWNYLQYREKVWFTNSRVDKSVSHFTGQYRFIGF